MWKPIKALGHIIVIQMTKKLLVTGSNGLVGSALKEMLPYEATQYDVLFATRKLGDLTSAHDTWRLFKDFKPDYVVHTAAKVGGIKANMDLPLTYFIDNMRINANILEMCTNFKVEKLIAFSSVCAYPDEVRTISEEKMHDGPPHHAHFGYAHAKRMVDVMIEAAGRQYKTNYCTVTPVNIYGKNDYYNLEHGHVVPSLTLKCWKAKKDVLPLTVWGNGQAIREFMYADDVARAIYKLLEIDLPRRLVLSSRESLTIGAVTQEIASKLGFGNNIFFDSTKPNGQMARPTDPRLFEELIPGFKWTKFNHGIAKTLDWFTKNTDNIRTS